MKLLILASLALFGAFSLLPDASATNDCVGARSDDLGCAGTWFPNGPGTDRGTCAGLKSDKFAPDYCHGLQL